MANGDLGVRFLLRVCTSFASCAASLALCPPDRQRSAGLRVVRPFGLSSDSTGFVDDLGPPLNGGGFRVGAGAAREG